MADLVAQQFSLVARAGVAHRPRSQCVLQASRSTAPRVAATPVCTAFTSAVRGEHAARRSRRQPVALSAEAVYNGSHEEEGGKFVPIGGEEGLGEAERFGPDALLVAGFTKDEVAVVRAMLDDMGADFIRTVVVDKTLLKTPLGKALETVQMEGAVIPAPGLPRLLLMSGMSSEEVMSLIEEYQETALEDLLSEISGDAAEMKAREAAAAAAAAAAAKV